MLTRTGAAILFTGLGLLTSGLALGNPFYATLSLVPVGILLVGLALEAPTGVRAEARVSKAGPRVGEEILVEVEYAIARGVGAIEIHVPLPDSFELKEGHNVRVVAKPWREAVEGSFTFTVRAAKRGPHEVGPLRVEAIHGPGIRAPASHEAAPALSLEVRPADAPVRRIRGLTGFAKQLFPDGDAAAQGIQTTEFRDIREYALGDPIKTINWRATARRPGFEDGLAVPLVNDYEREGKKSVWLFLDAAPYMQVGTTLENSFEHAITAASGVARFYLDRGYRLGAYIYNHDRSAFLYPEVGRRQLLRWTRVVTGLKPGADEGEGLHNAVERAHRWLLQEKPLVVVVTRIGRVDASFFLAMRKLRGLTGRRRRRVPVLVVSPVVHAAMPAHADYKDDIVALLRRRERPLVQRVRRTGVRVVEWDPTRMRFESALLQGAGARGGAR